MYGPQQETIEAIRGLAPAALASAVGGLVLVPENLHHVHRLETLGNLVSLFARGKGRLNPSRVRRLVLGPLASWVGRADDPWPSLACQSLAFHGGTFLFIPGGIDTLFILRHLSRILAFDPKIPDLPRNMGIDRLRFACRLSNEVVKRARLGTESRVPPPSGFSVPTSKRFAMLTAATRFTATAVEELADGLHPDAGLSFSQPSSRSRSVEIGVGDLRFHPCLTVGDETIVVAPHLLAEAALVSVLECEGEGFREQLARSFHLEVYAEVLETLERLGMRRSSPERCVTSKGDQAIITHSLFRCDTDKFHHVVFVTDALRGGVRDAWDTSHVWNQIAKARGAVAQVMEGDSRKWKTTVVVEGMGRDFEFTYPTTAQTPEVWVINAADLLAIANAENRDPLLLWKYQEDLGEIRKTTRIQSWSAADTYGLWRANDRGFYPDDAEPPHMIAVAPNFAERVRFESHERTGRSVLRGPTPGLLVEVVRAEGPEREVYRPIGTEQCIRVAVKTDGPVVWLTTSQPIPHERRQRHLEFFRMSAFWVSEFALVACRELAELGPNRVCEVEVSLLDDLGQRYVFGVGVGHAVLTAQYEFWRDYGRDNSIEREYARALGEAVFSALGMERADQVAERCRDVAAPLGVKRMLHALSTGSRAAFIGAESLPRPRLVQRIDARRLVRTFGDSGGVGMLGSAASQEWLITIVGRLYSRLQRDIGAFDKQELLRQLLVRYESLLHDDALRDVTFASQLACASSEPNFRSTLLDQIGDHARSSVALRFLVEYVVAEPPQGEKAPSLGAYDRWLALASLTVACGTAADVGKHGLAEVRVTVDPSGFTIDHGGYEPASRERTKLFRSERLREEQARLLVPHTAHTTKRSGGSSKFAERMEQIDQACVAEFGASFTLISEMFSVASKLAMRDDAPVVLMSRFQLEAILSEELNVSTEKASSVLSRFLLIARSNFTKAPKGFSTSDIWPWVFNRRLSYLQRPFVLQGDTVLFTPGHVQQALLNLFVLLTSARYPAQTKVLRQCMDKFVQAPNREFEEQVAIVCRERGFTTMSRVTKLGSTKIARSNGEDLGDIDVLAADTEAKTLYCLECKDIQLDRMPGETKNRLDALFVDSPRKRSAQTKHRERVRWIRGHLKISLAALGVDSSAGWTVVAAIVTQHPLLASMLGRVLSDN